MPSQGTHKTGIWINKNLLPRFYIGPAVLIWGLCYNYRRPIETCVRFIQGPHKICKALMVYRIGLFIKYYLKPMRLSRGLL